MVTPLKKRKQDGTLYTRDEKLTRLLTKLEAMDRSERLEHCEIKSRSDPKYVPTECLLYLVRACRTEAASPYAKKLYTFLEQRVLSTLPSIEGRSQDGKLQTIEGYSVNSRTREIALEDFQDMLLADVNPETYCYDLDYFEVRFNGALKALRTDAFRKAMTQARRQHAEFSDDIEQDLGLFPHLSMEQKLESENYQSALMNAIIRLPSYERMIIMMHYFEGVPIDSQDPDKPSLTKATGRVEKTVRNHRDRALEMLRQA
ncbi:MAG: hypothetical protein U1D69_11945, partial [Polynucleobacter sp.]|nr:hypothetical protein [Polynucleobacter sp.]